MNRRLLAVGMCAVLGACAETLGPPPPPPPEVSQGPAPAFSAGDFAWSVQRGSASIRGSVDYGHGFSCAGQPVVLVPVAPYSRWRILQLYGSDDHAVLPVAEVRSRQANRPSDAFSAYSKRTSCDGDGRFAFMGLPAGSWYVIAIAQPPPGQGQLMAIMRRIETRLGAAKSVMLD